MSRCIIQNEILSYGIAVFGCSMIMKLDAHAPPTSSLVRLCILYTYFIIFTAFLIFHKFMSDLILTAFREKIPFWSPPSHIGPTLDKRTHKRRRGRPRKAFIEETIKLDDRNRYVDMKWLALNKEERKPNS